MSDAAVLHRYQARWGAAEAALPLRSVCFRGGVGTDADAFDAVSEHLVITDAASETSVACCRVRFSTAYHARLGYTGQRYDLTHWTGTEMVAELGRVCLHPDFPSPDIPRLLWQALTRRIVAARVTRLFGCASLKGADLARHADLLAALHGFHRGPQALRPARAMTHAIHLDQITGDPQAGLSQIPPLLRSYLALGGWTGDHAVRDGDLDTLHVFAALDVADIPPARLRRLMGP